MKKCAFFLLAVFIFFFFEVVISYCELPDDAKNQYYIAENTFNNLKKNAVCQKYRTQWLFCINEFNKVYKLNPNGTWAAAGLYQAGLLYLELYKRSYLKTDLIEAIDIFQRIINRFPQSSYKEKSFIWLEQTWQRKKNDKFFTNDLNEKINLARMFHRKLMVNIDLQKYRRCWTKVINLYHDIYRFDPNGQFASKVLFIEGSLYRQLYKKSFKFADWDKSKEIFNKLQLLFPNDLFANKAKSLVSINKSTVLHNIDDENKNCKTSKHISSNINKFFVESGKNYTRLTIELDGIVNFSHGILEDDLFAKKTQCLYLDLDGCSSDIKYKIALPIHDNLFHKLQIIKCRYNVIRIVLNIKLIKSYQVISLKNPNKIVIDFYKRDKAEHVYEKSFQTLDDENKLTRDSIAQQLMLGVSKIVIDPGHGGRDHGASGFIGDVYEKNITLQIANCLARKIRNELNCKVVLTRNVDSYLSLEDRTAFANTENCDLFISIHTNASNNKNAYGIETFFLNFAEDNESILVAARENSTLIKNISDLESILNDLINNTKINESSRLAASVQECLCFHTNKIYDHILNKGVKQAPFYVLLGVEMPAILIETSFISNSRECLRLQDTQYQETLCDGIIMGIKKYIKG